MEYRGWFLAVVLCVLCGSSAEAGDKVKYFGKEKKPVRPVSFGPEFGDTDEALPVPRSAKKSGSRVATREGIAPPLLLAPSLAGDAYLPGPPPEPTPALPPGPVPDAIPYPVESPPIPAVPAAVDGPAVSLLFPHVCYKDLDNVPRCAVPMVVAVAHPCHKCGCVFVKVCVPPHCVPKVKCKDGGHEVEYDYGDFEVEIKSRDGVVTVDYDD